MKLRKLVKLMAFHRYPRYFRVLFLHYTSYIKSKIILRKVKCLGVNVAKSSVFYGMPIISIAMGSKIEVGDRCVICSDPNLTDLGVNHSVVMRTLRTGASIIIGNDTGISGGSICAAESVKIGDECLIGANVVITDTDFHSIDPIGRRYNEYPDKIVAEPVEIDNNVFIGTGAIILKGVKIGKNSIIGAGSVVTKSVPPNSVAAGNPATFLREI